MRPYTSLPRPCASDLRITKAIDLRERPARMKPFIPTLEPIASPGNRVCGNWLRSCLSDGPTALALWLTVHNPRWVREARPERHALDFSSRYSCT